MWLAATRQMWWPGDGATAVQAFDQLHFVAPALLRTSFDRDRVFRVTFKDEQGADAGGVFREVGVSRRELLFLGTPARLSPPSSPPLPSLQQNRSSARTAATGSDGRRQAAATVCRHARTTPITTPQ